MAGVAPPKIKRCFFLLTLRDRLAAVFLLVFSPSAAHMLVEAMRDIWASPLSGRDHFFGGGFGLQESETSKLGHFIRLFADG